jgi:DNA replication protein DnaC
MATTDELLDNLMKDYKNIAYTPVSKIRTTSADAVLDRLVHNAHMITMNMNAESMRKLMSKSR